MDAQDLIDQLADEWSMLIGGYGYEDRYPILEALISPRSPLWPALRALGTAARKYASGTSLNEDDVALKWLAAIANITGPLADACLAAAGVEP